MTTKTKRRGINKGFSTREARVALGRPLPLEWDVRGKTYKEIGDYSQHFSREIGILIRQYADPDYDRWDKLPSDVRDRILPRLEVIYFYNFFIGFTLILNLANLFYFFDSG